MARTSYHLKLVWPIALTSVLTFALCTLMAVLLFRQQQRVTAGLSENVVSRRAAADLEQRLEELVVRLKTDPEGVEALHDRIEQHLGEISRYADKDRERQLSIKLDQSFRGYLNDWLALAQTTGPAREQAVRQRVTWLETDTLKSCRELRDYNADQIEESEQEQSGALQRLAWGFAAVGLAGGLAGLILGYGVARALRRSIHRLQIHVQDAAGKLGQVGPAIVLTEEGDLDRLHEQMQALAGRIEHVVQQLQQREREVLRAEQLAAVGQLAAGVAHEIRNPLTAIKMLVQGVREDPKACTLSETDLEVIEQEIRRIERSLKTFLDFARPPRLERAALDLALLVDHTLALVQGRAAKQRVALAFPRPEHPVMIEADAEQLRQVMVNLALNALDAMPRGGRLEVRLKAEAASVELSVIDTGAGIQPDILPRLFQPFASSKETGLGLGLVVSRRIVEEHGGQLWGENRAGGGASFSFRLPRTPVAA